MADFRLGSREHDDLLAQFERDHKLKNPSRTKDAVYVRQGYLYDNGELCVQFRSYRMGYAFGKFLAENEALNRIAELEAQLAEAKKV